MQRSTALGLGQDIPSYASTTTEQSIQSAAQQHPNEQQRSKSRQETDPPFDSNGEVLWSD